jgi:hypothetical protein
VKVEGLLLQECTRSNTQLTRGCLNIFCKECEQDPFGKLVFTSESSGRITPLTCSKGDGDQNILI